MQIRVKTFDSRVDFEEMLNSIGEENILQMMYSCCMSSYGGIHNRYTVVYKSAY